jgi:hypothetical protein
MTDLDYWTAIVTVFDAEPFIVITTGTALPEVTLDGTCAFT